MIDFDFSAVIHIPSVEKTSAEIKIVYIHHTYVHMMVYFLLNSTTAADLWPIYFHTHKYEFIK